mgnify:CR=1 FL=1
MRDIMNKLKLFEGVKIGDHFPEKIDADVRQFAANSDIWLTSTVNFIRHFVRSKNYDHDAVIKEILRMFKEGSDSISELTGLAWLIEFYQTKVEWPELDMILKSIMIEIDQNSIVPESITEARDDDESLMQALIQKNQNFLRIPGAQPGANWNPRNNMNYLQGFIMRNGYDKDKALRELLEIMKDPESGFEMRYNLRSFWFIAKYYEEHEHWPELQIILKSLEKEIKVADSTRVDEMRSPETRIEQNIAQLKLDITNFMKRHWKFLRVYSNTEEEDFDIKEGANWLRWFVKEQGSDKTKVITEILRLMREEGGSGKMPVYNFRTFWTAAKFYQEQYGWPELDIVCRSLEKEVARLNVDLMGYEQ